MRARISKSPGPQDGHMTDALKHVTHTLNFMPSAPTLCSVCPAPYTPYTVLYTVPYCVAYVPYILKT